jgi:hypothetical protein
MTDEPEEREPYEAPQVVRIGTLRDTLSQGPAPDGSVLDDGPTTATSRDR